LTGLVQNLPSDQVAYQVVSGVQGGALNAGLLGKFAVGDELSAIGEMQRFWVNASQTPLYKDWKGGVVDGLLFKGGLYDSSPLRAFLEAEFSGSSPSTRHVNVGLVDVLTGDYRDFSEKTMNGSPDEIVDVMFASFSIPGYFAPAVVDGSSYFDGSAIWDIDITSVVNKCMELGFKAADIVVDVIMVDNTTLAFENTTDYNSLEMLFRYLEIARYYGTFDGLLRAQFAYPDVNFRYIVGPSSKLPESRFHVPLNLNSTQMEEMFEMGISDAKNIINLGEKAVLP